MSPYRNLLEFMDFATHADPGGARPAAREGDGQLFLSDMDAQPVPALLADASDYTARNVYAAAGQSALAGDDDRF